MFLCKTKKLIIFFFLMATLTIPNLSYGYPRIADELRSTGMEEAWSVVLGLVNIVAVIGLIFIALAYLFRIDLETYDIKRTLPGLIVGVILANFSYFLIIEVVDIVSSVTDFFIQLAGPGDGIGKILYSSMTGQTTVGGIFTLTGVIALFFPYVGALGLPMIIVGALLLIIPLILWVMLTFVLYVRYYVIVILFVLSPVAVVLYFIPLGKSIAGMWFDWFLKFLLVGPVIFISVWLINVLQVQASDTPWGGFIGGIVLIIAALIISYQLVGMSSISGAVLGFFKGKAGETVSKSLGRAGGFLKWGAKVRSRKLGNDDQMVGMGRFYSNVNKGLEGEKHIDDILENALEVESKETGKSVRKSWEEHSLGQEMLRTQYHDKAMSSAENIKNGGIEGALGALYAGNADTRTAAIRALGMMFNDPDYKDDKPLIKSLLQGIGEASGKGKGFYDPSTTAGQQMINDEKGILFEKISDKDIKNLQKMAGLEIGGGNYDLIAEATVDNLNSQEEIDVTITNIEGLQAEIKNKSEGELESSIVDRVVDVTGLPEDMVHTKESALGALSDYSISAPAFKSYVDRTGNPPNSEQLALEIDLNDTISTRATAISRTVADAPRPAQVLSTETRGITTQELATRKEIKEQIKRTLEHEAVGDISEERVDEIIGALSREISDGRIESSTIEEAIREQISEQDRNEENLNE